MKCFPYSCVGFDKAVAGARAWILAPTSTFGTEFTLGLGLMWSKRILYLGLAVPWTSRALDKGVECHYHWHKHVKYVQISYDSLANRLLVQLI